MLVRVKSFALGNLAVIPRFTTSILTQRGYIISYLLSVIIIYSVSFDSKKKKNMMRIHFHKTRIQGFFFHLCISCSTKQNAHYSMFDL